MADIETNGTPVNDYTLDISTLDVTGLAHTTPYYFNVIVKDAAGNKTAYTAVNTTTKTPPAEVTPLTATVDNTTIAITWTDPVIDDGVDGNFDHVEITWTPNGATPQTVFPGTQAYTVSGLTLFTYYTVTIKTVDDEGNTSDGLSFTVRTASGSTDLYYFINSADDLYAVRGGGTGVYADWDLTDRYILMANIDPSTYTSYNATYGWVPIGNGTTSFTGYFDGNNYTVTNLFINRGTTNYVGLFGASSGSIKNLNIKVNITGQNFTGGLVGWNQTGGTITNCSVTVTEKVNGGNPVGGITGHNQGTVLNCEVMVCDGKQIYGGSSTGGIVGRNLSLITNCTVSVDLLNLGTGKVSGMNSIGGIAGAVQSGTLSGCSASGLVTNSGGASYIGGIAGQNGGTISECVASNTITSTIDYTGGLIGYNSGTVTDCSATGAVSGTTNVGGLIGYNTSSLTDCFATGDISGTGNNIGGLVGYNDTTSVLTNCYYTTGTVSASATAIRTGAGGLVGENRGMINGCYVTGNIDADANYYWTGGLSGGNYGTIDGCYFETGEVNSTGNVTGGLVGFNFSSGTVTDCFASGAVSGKDFTGGLSGNNDGNIENCHASGSVNGSSHVGGLVGWNTRTITICYATGTVTNSSTSFTGGLVGDNSTNNAVLTDCYATGAVNGLGQVGGLVGANSDAVTLTNCYAAGAVSGVSNLGGLVGSNAVTSTITSCYYDSETTGQSDNTGKGEPKTTLEMQTQGTFTGWDFAGETTNGTEDIWNINSSINDGYPYLQ